MQEFFYETGKKIIIVEVDPAQNVPVAFKGEKYIRVGSYTKKLSGFPEKERKIWKSSATTLVLRTRLLSTRAGKSDLDTMLDYRKYFILMQMPVPSDATTLRQRLVEDGIIYHTTSDVIEATKLGALLFAEKLEHWQGMSCKAVRIIIREGKGRLGL